MTRKLSVGVLAVSLLMSGAFVGISFGGGGGITEPEVIELSVAICGRSGPCRFFFLEDPEDHSTGQITLIRNPLFDADNNEIGRINISCVVSDGPGGITNWVCTSVLGLRAGPYTERGTVVTTGIYGGPGDPDVFAVTGGTGAYTNVRGYATQEEGPGRDSYVLHLTP